MPAARSLAQVRGRRYAGQFVGASGTRSKGTMQQKLTESRPRLAPGGSAAAHAVPVSSFHLWRCSRGREMT